MARTFATGTRRLSCLTGVILGFAFILVCAPHSAWATFYARTNQPVTIEGKTYPAGNYIAVDYDGGDVWLTKSYPHASGFLDQVGFAVAMPSVPKSAVTLIPLIINEGSYYLATVNKPTPFYSPNVFLYPTTLNHLDENHVTLKKGDKVEILLRQGDGYAAVLRGPGRPGGRVLISDVDIDPGQTAKWRELKVPPAPAAALAKSNIPGWIIYAGPLLLLGLAAYIFLKLLQSRFKSSSSLAVAAGGPTALPVDTKKWILDRSTGEYYRIKVQHKGGSVTDGRSHAARTFYYYDQRRSMSIKVPISIGIIVLLILGYSYLRNVDDPLADIPRFLFYPAVAICIAFAIMGSAKWLYLVLSKDSLIGPPPIPRPGAEEVEQQKVHGEGRMMTREEMDRALRGNSQSARIQTFED